MCTIHSVKQNFIPDYCFTSKTNYNSRESVLALKLRIFSYCTLLINIFYRFTATSLKFKIEHISAKLKIRYEKNMLTIKVLDICQGFTKGNTEGGHAGLSRTVTKLFVCVWPFIVYSNSVHTMMYESFSQNRLLDCTMNIHRTM